MTEPKTGVQFFLDVLYHLIKPIASFCVSRSIKFQDFIEVTKRAFVDAANAELTLTNHTISDSKLSVMTGLQRKDIARLKDSTHLITEPSNLITRIIGLWLSERYQNAEGKPKKLTFEGKQSSFATLVQEVSQDLNHHTVLFELERLNIIQRNQKEVTLSIPAFVIRGDVQRSLPLLSADIEDLSRAIIDNMTDNAPIPHLHAKTEYDNIPASSLPNIRAWLIALGQEMHQRARDYFGKFDRDINPDADGKGSRSRIAFGTFSFSHELIDPKSSDKTKKGKT